MPGRRLASCRARARSPKLWPPGCSIPRLCTRCRRRGWLTRCTPRSLRASRPAYFRWTPSCRLSAAIRRSGVRELAGLGLAWSIRPASSSSVRAAIGRPDGLPSPLRRQQTKPKPSIRPAARTGIRTPSSRRVAADITARIESGELAPGTRLRSERDLAAHYEVAYHTIRRAMEILRERGLIVSIHGCGTFVREPPTPEPRCSTSGPASSGDLVPPQAPRQPVPSYPDRHVLVLTVQAPGLALRQFRDR